MGSENKNGKVPLISKIAYGFGDVGCNFSWMFVSNFLMIFYTDVFGISMAAVSALMLFSRFWDAINDPIVGGLTDKTKSRWGRYRPWLLVAAPITAILLVMTLWARPDWPQIDDVFDPEQRVIREVRRIRGNGAFCKRCQHRVGIDERPAREV